MKVSIVICTRNRANLLQDAIKSALQQDYENYEIIIIDNGSTDNTKELVQDLATKYKNIVYVYEPQAGLHNAMKKAYCEISNADFVTILHDDDLLIDNSFLSKSIEIYKKHQDQNIIAIFSNLEVFNLTNNTQYDFYNCFSEGLHSGKELFIDGKICTDAGIVIKRDIIEKLDVFHNSTSGIDIEIVYKMALLGNFYYIDTYSYRHHIHGENFSLMSCVNIANNIKSGMCTSIIAEFAKHHKVFSNELIAAWETYKAGGWLADITDKVVFEYHAFVMQVIKQLPINSKIYIFGASKQAYILITYIKQNRSDIQILGYIDDNPNAFIDGYKKLSYEEIDSENYVILTMQGQCLAHKVSMKLTKYFNADKIYCILNYDIRSYLNNLYNEAKNKYVKEYCG